jgi:integrase
LPRKAPTLSEFSTRFLQWIEKSPLEANSKRYYRNALRLIRDTDLAGVRLDRITSDEVHSIRWRDAPAYVNQVIRTLRRMLGKAAEWGVIPSAPRIKLLKEYGRERLIDAAAEAKLLAVAKQSLRDVLLVMLDTGLRPQEVFRMS